jgi:hypothetical protein
MLVMELWNGVVGGLWREALATREPSLLEGSRVANFCRGFPTDFPVVGYERRKFLNSL